jgi:hypothetical protein
VYPYKRPRYSYRVLTYTSQFATAADVPCHMHVILMLFSRVLYVKKQATVAERSEACTVFVRSEAGIVGSNSTRGIDV